MYRCWTFCTVCPNRIIKRPRPQGDKLLQSSAGRWFKITQTPARMTGSTFRQLQNNWGSPLLPVFRTLLCSSHHYSSATHATLTPSIQPNLKPSQHSSIHSTGQTSFHLSSSPHIFISVSLPSQLSNISSQFYSLFFSSHCSYPRSLILYNTNCTITHSYQQFFAFRPNPLSLCVHKTIHKLVSFYHRQAQLPTPLFTSPSPKPTNTPQARTH